MTPRKGARCLRSYFELPRVGWEGVAPTRLLLPLIQGALSIRACYLRSMALLTTIQACTTRRGTASDACEGSRWEVRGGEGDGEGEEGLDFDGFELEGVPRALARLGRRALRSGGGFLEMEREVSSGGVG